MSGVLAGAGSVLAAMHSKEAGRQAPEVRIEIGLIRGRLADGVENYLGIPYAAPPVGSLRWRAPQAASPWKGTRSAEAYGSICAQPKSIDAPRTEIEDCLFINVQRPVGTQLGARLPVLVFIHGGGFITGSGNNENMEKIVRDTGIIGITMNYRLGTLGFLMHPALRADSDAGSYGFLDQQAALQWVKRNVEAFGGDADRVTIGGESAGGMSVCAHLVSARSRGLFSQAIIQSGACVSQPVTEADMEGQKTAAALGCSDPVSAATCLRGKTVADLLDEARPFWLPASGKPPLSEDFRDAVSSGHFSHVPLIIGTTRDEGRAFSQGSIGWSREQYQKWANGYFGPNAALVLAAYTWPSGSDRFTAAYLVGAVLTDSGTVMGGINKGLGACANRLLAIDFNRVVPVYAYEFAPRAGPAWFVVPGFDWGAGHATDLPYLFPKRNGGENASRFGKAETQLSDELIKAWAGFVKDGTPSMQVPDSWPLYAGNRVLMSFDTQGRSALLEDRTFREEHHCDLWDKLGAG